MREQFRKFAHDAACAMGSSWAFFLACAVVAVWAVSGPIFSYSDSWQLVINTGTTIVTFLMVFLIQATQNRDSKAIHLKLDELLRAIGKARTGLVGLEDMRTLNASRPSLRLSRLVRPSVGEKNRSSRTAGNRREPFSECPRRDASGTKRSLHCLSFAAAIARLPGTSDAHLAGFGC
jgi:low affinity Fe/Cu permease